MPRTILLAVRGGALLLSLLLCLLVGALSVRSFRAGDVFACNHNVVAGREMICNKYDLATGDGVVAFAKTRSVLEWPRVIMRPDGSVTGFPLGRHVQWTRQRPEGLPDMGWERSFLGRRGFAWWSQYRGGTYQYHTAVPLWLPALVFAFGPLTWAGRRIANRLRAARRRATNLCVGCGYDLRGGGEGGNRCPECGLSQSDGIRAVRPGWLAFGIVGVVIVIGVWSLFAMAPWDDPAGRAVVARVSPRTALPVTAPFTSVQNRPATSLPTTARVATRNAADRQGLRRGAEFWRVTHQQLREAAASLDRSRTYVFLYVSNPANADYERHVYINLFARVDGQWRVDKVDRRPGEVVGSTLIPYPLRIGEIRLDDDKDLVVTFVDSAGRVVETHSAFDDRADNTNKLLQRFSMQSNSELEREFFPSK